MKEKDWGTTLDYRRLRWHGTKLICNSELYPGPENNALPFRGYYYRGYYRGYYLDNWWYMNVCRL